MDRFAAMQVYRTVVTSGSFAQAARQLQISTASASRNVSDLERHLGTTLLRRSSRSLLMTEAGKTYYAHCCEILDRITEAENLAAHAKSDVQGRLRVSMPAAFGVRYIAPLLPQFMERYPQIEVDVWCSDQFVDFTESGFDVAIRITRELDDKLIARKLGPVRCVACASPQYLQWRGTPETPAALREHDCLTYAYASYGDNWQFFKNGAEVIIPVASIFRSNCGEVIRQACLAGRGIAVMPTFLIAEELRNGAVVELFSDHQFCDYSAYAVYPVDMRNSVRTGVFIDFLGNALANVLPV